MNKKIKDTLKWFVVTKLGWSIISFAWIINPIRSYKKEKRNEHI